MSEPFYEYEATRLWYTARFDTLRGNREWFTRQVVELLKQMYEAGKKDAAVKVES